MPLLVNAVPKPNENVNFDKANNKGLAFSKTRSLPTHNSASRVLHSTRCAFSDGYFQSSATNNSSSTHIDDQLKLEQNTKGKKPILLKPVSSPLANTQIDFTDEKSNSNSNVRPMLEHFGLGNNSTTFIQNSVYPSAHETGSTVSNNTIRELVQPAMLLLVKGDDDDVNQKIGHIKQIEPKSISWNNKNPHSPSALPYLLPQSQSLSSLTKLSSANNSNTVVPLHGLGLDIDVPAQSSLITSSPINTYTLQKNDMGTAPMLLSKLQSISPFTATPILDYSKHSSPKQITVSDSLFQPMNNHDRHSINHAFVEAESPGKPIDSIRRPASPSRVSHPYKPMLNIPQPKLPKPFSCGSTPDPNSHTNINGTLINTVDTTNAVNYTDITTINIQKFSCFESDTSPTTSAFPISLKSKSGWAKHSPKKSFQLPEMFQRRSRTSSNPQVPDMKNLTSLSQSITTKHSSKHGSKSSSTSGNHEGLFSKNIFAEASLPYSYPFNNNTDRDDMSDNLTPLSPRPIQPFNGLSTQVSSSFAHKNLPPLPDQEKSDSKKNNKSISSISSNTKPTKLPVKLALLSKAKSSSEQRDHNKKDTNGEPNNDNRVKTDNQRIVSSSEERKSTHTRRSSIVELFDKVRIKRHWRKESIVSTASEPSASEPEIKDSQVKGPTEFVSTSVPTQHHRKVSFGSNKHTSVVYLAGMCDPNSQHGGNSTSNNPPSAPTPVNRSSIKELASSFRIFNPDSQNKNIRHNRSRSSTFSASRINAPIKIPHSHSLDGASNSLSKILNSPVFETLSESLESNTNSHNNNTKKPLDSTSSGNTHNVSQQPLKKQSDNTTEKDLPRLPSSISDSALFAPLDPKVTVRRRSNKHRKTLCVDFGRLNDRERAKSFNGVGTVVSMYENAAHLDGDLGMGISFDPKFAIGTGSMNQNNYGKVMFIDTSDSNPSKPAEPSRLSHQYQIKRYSPVREVAEEEEDNYENSIRKGIRASEDLSDAEIVNTHKKGKKSLDYKPKDYNNHGNRFSFELEYGKNISSCAEEKTSLEDKCSSFGAANNDSTSRKSSGSSNIDRLSDAEQSLTVPTHTEKSSSTPRSKMSSGPDPEVLRFSSDSSDKSSSPQDDNLDEIHLLKPSPMLSVVEKEMTSDTTASPLASESAVLISTDNDSSTEYNSPTENESASGSFAYKSSDSGSPVLSKFESITRTFSGFLTDTEDPNSVGLSDYEDPIASTTTITKKDFVGSTFLSSEQAFERLAHTLVIKDTTSDEPYSRFQRPDALTSSKPGTAEKHVSSLSSVLNQSVSDGSVYDDASEIVEAQIPNSKSVNNIYIRETPEIIQPFVFKVNSLEKNDTLVHHSSASLDKQEKEPILEFGNQCTNQGAYDHSNRHKLESNISFRNPNSETVSTATNTSFERSNNRISDLGMSREQFKSHVSIKTTLKKHRYVIILSKSIKTFSLYPVLEHILNWFRSLEFILINSIPSHFS